MIKTHRPARGMLVLTAQIARIDAAVAMKFKAAARKVLQTETGRVILDLERVTFLDSSGLGTLVAIMKMLDDGRRLELAACSGAVRKVLALTRMDSIFILHDRVPTADAPPPKQRDAPLSDGQDAA